MWRKKAPTDSKIASRVSKLSRTDLVAWADQAIYSTGRCLTAYQRDPLLEYLEEARSGAAVLAAIIDEIQRRDSP